MRRLILMGLVGLIVQNAPTTENGSIQGVVTSLTTTAPIADVEVTILPGAYGPRRTTTTDPNGRFEFDNVLPGIYAVQARRDGYSAGVNNADDVAVVTVSVQSGQRLRITTLRLSRTPVFRGRVFEANDAPLAKTLIEFLQVSYDELGTRVWQVAGGALTNENGEYEAHLTAGDYYVRTRRPTVRQGTTARAIATYYPGTIDAAKAATLRVVEGDDRTLDLKESLSETYTVEGRILASAPQLAKLPRISLALAVRNPGLPGESSLESIAQLFLGEGADGTFRLTNVQPGIYDLIAVGYTQNPPPLAPAISHFGNTVVVVRDRDVEGVSLLLEPGIEVTGRLVIEGDGQGVRFGRPGGPAPPRGIPPGERVIRTVSSAEATNFLNVRLLRKDGYTTSFNLSAVSQEDGTAFTIRDVSKGAYSVQIDAVSIRPISTYVADIRRDGISVFDHGLQIDGKTPVNLDVIVRSDGGTVSGTVTGLTANSAEIVLVPSPQRRQNPALYPRMTVLSGESAAKSLFFRLYGVPPGDYTIFAWEGREFFRDKPFMNEEFIALHQSRGTAVKVSPNGVVSEVKVAAIPVGQ